MKLQPDSWNWPMIAALMAAVVLLLAGIGMARYEDELYTTQQIRDVTEQAQILAASVTAAVSFSDRDAAQEYVDALKVNPELRAAGVYDLHGKLFAQFSRAPSLLAATKPGQGQSAILRGDVLTIAQPVAMNGRAIGAVSLIATTEPAQRRIARYAGLVLLVTMGALVIGVLAFSTAALSRRAEELSDVNLRLQTEMGERQKTEEALRQSHKMEAVGQLSGGIAHDFNNLIMIAKSNLRMLQKKMAQSGTQNVQYVTSADEALDRAAALTQRILAFSRRQPLSPQPVRLSDLIEGMDQLIRSSAGEGVSIQTALKARWWTLCDVNQMENVILNLAINARDAMPGGGPLTIETRDVTLTTPPPDVAEFVPGDYVALLIRDTGEGMSDTVRERALDPFFTTKPQGKGTGLGLSMTFGYVRQSNGYLVIESAPGKGATITIFMPRHPGGWDMSQILLAEDEAMLRAIAVEMLEDAGYAVFQAGDGEEALALLKSNPGIEVLVSDIKMPRMDGYALAEAGLQLRPELKILLMTGYAQDPPPSLLRAREIHTLHKPFNLERLCELVDEMVGRA